MKTLFVKDTIHGRRTKVNARSTYQAADGTWVAEIDEKEIQNACYTLYRGVKECPGEDLSVQSARDDDGKEYRIVTS